jgi:spore coat polysaccharide biosynthesis protein SpsF
MRKLIAALACRSNGSRLYGKPLQNLDKGVTILSQIISCLKKISCIDSIVLGISDSVENKIFEEIAKSQRIGYIYGNEVDVLHRLITCGEKESASDIFRVTTESPFPNYALINEGWEKHLSGNYDATFLDEVIDGCGFEFIKLDALKISHANGEDKHRSEMCTLYIRENKDRFNIDYLLPSSKLIRKDLRLTVDNPEDLIVCANIYKKFKNLAPFIPLDIIVDYLDENPELVNLIKPYCEVGYKTMYL